MRRALLVLATLVVAISAVPPMSSVERARAASGDEVLVVWAAEGLPANIERALDRMKGVDATTVVGGTMWMSRSTSEGAPVDDPGGDRAIPMEVAFVQTKEYARYLGDAGERALIASLGPKEAVMPVGETSLRGGHDRLMVRLDGRSRRVIGSVSNFATQGYELLMAAPAPDSWRRYRYVIVSKEPGVSRAAIARKVRSLIPDSHHLKISAKSDVRYLRYADSVHPLFVFKKAFGEWAAPPSREGGIAIDPSWVERNITTESVPILGAVRCHRELFPQMRRALREVKRKGLEGTIRTDEYAGCFNPRYVATIPGTRLSRHTWGIAFDINTSGNGFGQEPNQDPRLVRIMRKWGFLWGGIWPLADGMHFEWKRFP